MIKELLFIIWALIFPIFFGIKNLKKTPEKNLVAGKKPLKQPVPVRANLFPVFCQDTMLLFPMCGFILVLFFWHVDSGPGIVKLMNVLCLAQLTIVDLVRGLKISISPFGNIRYNPIFFLCILALTVIHIISLTGILYVNPVSLLALMVVSISSSISTWKYIEDLYDGKVEG